MLIEGNYYALGRITVSRSGTPGNRIKIEPAPGTGRLRFNGLTLSGNYIHVNNLVSGGHGPTERGGNVVISGDFNILEDIISEWTASSGFNSGGSAGADPETWPKGNLYLNCVSRYHNDGSNGADGFALKNGGPGNVYIGCIAYHNIDDGWDFFNRVEDGPSAKILIINSIAYSNGANGFKLGGETQASPHEIWNSLAFNNGMAGYSCNFNPGPMIIQNNISIDNWNQNIIFRYNPNVAPQTNELVNSVSYRSQALRDRAPGMFDYVEGIIIDSFMTDPEGVSRNGNRVLSDSDFHLITVDFTKLGGDRFGVPNTLADAVIDPTELAKVYTRDASGNLVLGNYGRLRNWAPVSTPPDYLYW